MTFLRRLAYAWPAHFWLIWLCGLIAVLAVPLWMFRKGWREDGTLRVTEAQPPQKLSKLVAAGFAAFVACYLGFMLWGEGFAYKDGHWFTEFTAIGKPSPPAIWTDSGRFWPLGYQEYNLLAHLSATATCYLAYGALQLVVGLWLLYLALWRESPRRRLLLFVSLMLAPAFGADFAELTYADRNVVFCVCVLIFAVERYERRPRQTWLLLAIASSYCGLYYKETSVALFGGFAATRLLLTAWREGWQAMRRSPLAIGIVLACACFAVELGLTLLPAGTSAYVDELSVGRLTAAMRYVAADPLLALFLVAFTARVIRVLRSGARFEPLWDALAAGGVLHFAALAGTGVAETYLLGPSELVAAVTLLRLTTRWWEERPAARPVLACVSAVGVTATLLFGSFRLIQRKAVVWQTQRLADFVVGFYRKPEASETRLYLPAEEGVVMNFVSFLSYRGLPVRRSDHAPGREVIEVAGAAHFERELCVPSSDLVCKHDVARPGDLVVRLPEESWSAVPTASADAGLRHVRLEPLFQATPTMLSGGLRPLVAMLYRVSPTLTGRFANQPLPDDWLRVSAAKVTPLVVDGAPQ